MAPKLFVSRTETYEGSDEKVMISGSIPLTIKAAATALSLKCGAIDPVSALDFKVSDLKKQVDITVTGADPACLVASVSSLHGSRGVEAGMLRESAGAYDQLNLPLPRPTCLQCTPIPHCAVDQQTGTSGSPPCCCKQCNDGFVAQCNTIGGNLDPSCGVANCGCQCTSTSEPCSIQKVLDTEERVYWCPQQIAAAQRTDQHLDWPYLQRSVTTANLTQSAARTRATPATTRMGSPRTGRKRAARQVRLMCSLLPQ